MSSEASDALELDVLIDAPAALVWSAFAERQHREAWWSYLDLDARPGGQLLERWPDAHGQERQTRGQVLEADPGPPPAMQLARRRLALRDPGRVDDR